MLEQTIMNLAVNARDGNAQRRRTFIGSTVTEVTPDRVQQNPEARVGSFRLP